MRFGWVGSHVEGLLPLRAVLENGYHLEAFFTLQAEHAAKRSGAADHRPLARNFGVPVFEVANINDSVPLLRQLELDVVFVIGWSQIIRPETLQSVRVGMIGAHASLLPVNRGRAPINWALIQGHAVTGNTLMWLSEDVDAGDIIDQTRIPITPYDTCASLYEQVAISNRDMILRLLPRLLAGERPGRPQPSTTEPHLPGRRPEDGRIDWSKSAGEVYNFVRALTRPYPGATGWVEGTRWKIWQCALLPQQGVLTAPPGQILGPVLSPVSDACGLLVACGDGAVILLELEDDNGEVLKGRRLSDLPWKGKVWTHGQQDRSGSSSTPG